jgi:CRP/FNR family transcriptional regulator, nitrogen oxide reductase regulator
VPIKVADEIHARAVNSGLLAGLNESTLRQVLDAARVRHIPAKKKVIVQGEQPDQLLLLQKGRARSYLLTKSGSEIVLLWLVPGDILGLVSLLADPPSYMVNTATVSECEFLVWDRTTIRKLAKNHTALTENGFRLALHYLQVYMKRHASIVTDSAESRLAQTLLKLASDAGEVRPSGITVDITNEQLSSLADIGFFTASRILSDWAHDGKISKHRGQVTLLDPESLMAVESRSVG